MTLPGSSILTLRIVELPDGQISLFVAKLTANYCPSWTWSSRHWVPEWAAEAELRWKSEIRLRDRR